jgi:hypothetical protein
VSRWVEEDGQGEEGHGGMIREPKESAMDEGKEGEVLRPEGRGGEGLEGLNGRGRMFGEKGQEFVERFCFL